VLALTRNETPFPCGVSERLEGIQVFKEINPFSEPTDSYHT